MLQVAMTVFGADCYAYGLLAMGCCDLVAEADMKPYDYLALVPVVEGAGGVVSDWEGDPLTWQPGLDGLKKHQGRRYCALGGAGKHFTRSIILCALYEVHVMNPFDYASCVQLFACTDGVCKV